MTGRSPKNTRVKDAVPASSVDLVADKWTKYASRSNATQSMTNLNLEWLWHCLQQLGDCLNEGVYLPFFALTQGHLFEQLFHLLSEERHLRGSYKTQSGYGLHVDVQVKRLTCILSRLQWKRLSASFSWFSSSAVGGLYRSFLDSLMGWYAASPPAASSTLLIWASSSSLFGSNFEGTVCRKASQYAAKTSMEAETRIRC